MACAESSAAGLQEVHEQASELKPYNLGRVAIDGLFAVKKVKMAIPEPDDVLGGKRGFIAVLTDTPHPEYLTDFLNSDYVIEGIYQNVHAACRHCHPAIDATLELRTRIHFMPKQVDKIKVYTYKLAKESHDHTDILGISSAKLSTPIAVALTLVKGYAGYADYNGDNLNDYWIKNLTQKVRVAEDENLIAQSPAVRGARVKSHMKDGNEYEATCLYPKGEPENPLTQEELEEKIRGLAMYGGLTNKERDEMIGEIWKKGFLDRNDNGHSMQEIKKQITPFSEETISQLKVGDVVSITGYIFCGRDASYMHGKKCVTRQIKMMKPSNEC